MATHKVIFTLFGLLVILPINTAIVKDYSICGESSLNTRARIVGGTIARPGMWPWHVGIYKQTRTETKLICGGALIAKRWVLTAAHCFYTIKRSPARIWHEKDTTPVTKYSIMAGDYNILQVDATEQKRWASEIAIHPGYRHAPYYENDIALIKLNQSVAFGPYVRSLCLPKKSDRPLTVPGSFISVPGWGRSRYSQFSPVLKFSTFRIQSNSKCRQATTYFFNSSGTFCAGDGRGVTDTCKGDSGGSLVKKVSRNGVYRWVSVGLVSWGEGCAMKDKYGYNTRVEAFIDWIQQKIANGCGNPGSIPNGRFTGKDFSIGSRVVYHCLNGFKFKGKSSRRCKSNRKWTRAPVCQRNRCKAIVQMLVNRRIKGTKLLFRRSSYSQVMYKCAKGYTLPGGTKSVVRRCVNGRLLGREPRCRVTCPEPKAIVGGIRIGDAFYHGRTVRFQCFRQWTLAGAHVLTCKDSRWDFSTPRCSPPCPNPRTPVGGYRIDNDFTHGKTVRFRCLGKRRMFGSPNITCNDGKWYNDPPKCLWGLCPDPGIPVGGFRLDLDFRHNKSVRFQCMDGRKLRGKGVITCVHGQWNYKIPRCLSSQELLETEKPEYSVCGINIHSQRQRIVGGIDAGHGTWPWQVGIYRPARDGNMALRCGGALIAKRWVLTVAGCFHSGNKQHESVLVPQMNTIIAGDYDRRIKESTQQELQAEAIFVHPNFSRLLYNNDIALIKLPDQLKLSSFVRPVCLPKQNEDLVQPGKSGVVAGWGATQVLHLGQLPSQRHRESRTLLQTALLIQSEKLCNEKTRYHFNATVTFCAGDGKGGNDTCTGDSGGSLVREVLRDSDQHRWVSVGLVSWGEGCGLKDKYSYFTKVQSFVDWIQKTIQDNQ